MTKKEGIFQDSSHLLITRWNLLTFYLSSLYLFFLSYLCCWFGCISVWTLNSQLGKICSLFCRDLNPFSRHHLSSMRKEANLFCQSIPHQISWRLLMLLTCLGCRIEWIVLIISLSSFEGFQVASCILNLDGCTSFAYDRVRVQCAGWH